MLAYRAYFYDRAGKIWLAEDFEASDDADAIQVATISAPVEISGCEVWERTRLVHRSAVT
jgi:hypothetical protein